MKTCNKCKLEKDVSLFNKNASSRGGYKSICKKCEKEGKTPLPKSYFKNRSLVGRYGITLEEYDAMLKAQGNSCAICKTHISQFTKSLAVDHCHTTGKNRGLLCQHCNTGLGQFRDNQELLSEAIKYLQEHSE